MKRRILYLIIFTAAILFSSCGVPAPSSAPYDGELYSPRYAGGFALYRCGESSSVLQVNNPWQGAEGVATELFISRNGESAPAGFAGESVRLPLSGVVCLSSSYIAFIDALGEVKKIKGVSGARYVTNAAVREAHEAGQVKDVGYDANLNYELLASLKPDIVFIYGIGGENTAVTNKLKELGITVVYVAEYLEEDPLGKAEWIVAFGEMFDKRETAENIFTDIADNYETLKGTAANFPLRPTVMLNAPYRDVWFVPGDRSYMVRLLRDAGGDYAFAGVDNSVSRPISAEAAWLAADRADVWINPNQALSLAEIKSQNPKFASVKAVKEERVYNGTKRRTEGGGSDLWESGALRADRVLEDLIICLHPEWSGGTGETYYYEQLR